MPRSRPSYPPEFKEEAVRLVRSSDEQWPIPKIARDLGVAPDLEGFQERLLRLARQGALGEGEGRRGAHREHREHIHRDSTETYTAPRGSMPSCVSWVSGALGSG